MCFLTVGGKEKTKGPWAKLIQLQIIFSFSFFGAAVG